MRVNDFLDLVAHETHKQLPARWRNFRTWKRYTLIQLFYGQRAIHYEVWVRGGEIHALEIGLHCEADAATNTKLLQLFDAHLPDIKHALGDQIEAEQWTKSWTRVHELMPYRSLDETTARRCAERLAQIIPVLEPLMARTNPGATKRAPAKKSLPSRSTARQRTSRAASKRP